MDLLQIVYTLVFVFIVFLFLSGRFRPYRNKCTVPMIKGAWPIIGHFPIFAGKESTHRLLGSMVNKYGPVFLTRLGAHELVIVNCHKIAKEIYTVHDKALDRPPIMASEILGYNNAMITFSPYGSYWRELRKITTVELLSTQRLDLNGDVRKTEVGLEVKEMYSVWEKQGRPENGVLIEMTKRVKDMLANISLMMIVGKRLFGNVDGDEARKNRKLIRKSVDFFGIYTITDVIPDFRFLDFVCKWDMKKTAKELDVVLDRWIQEHKQKKASGRNKQDALDFIDVMLDALENSKIDSDFNTDTILKANCLNLIFAGSETSNTAVIWTIALLANHPEMLKRVQEEMDQKIGKNRVVQESDINELVYLQAVVKESTRLYPSVPMLSVRRVMEDFTLSHGNYHVPAGSEVILNAWQIHRDPSVWPDPHRFDPERFLTTHKDVDGAGKSFELVSFGLGRRSCPAANLGNRMIHYTLARFLQAFDIAKPSNQDIDLTETNAMLNVKTNPLEVLVTPRLDSKLY